jgi:hypothetical protein
MTVGMTTPTGIPVTFFHFRGVLPVPLFKVLRVFFTRIVFVYNPFPVKNGMWTWPHLMPGEGKGQTLTTAYLIQESDPVLDNAR